MAVITRDYTSLKPGTKHSDGQIVACPHCGLPALLEGGRVTKRYLHSETKGIDENGKPVLDWAKCPKAPASTPPAKAPLG